MTEEKLKEIIDALSELGNDSAVPKNVKNKVNQMINILEDDSELSIRVNKVLNELDEIADDTNMQAYTRIQILNIVSLLETIQTS
ncbi:hypothetical protein COY26_00385 [Candidatus Woesearchaeota archaeon CG_4_10_14_0_2_um_filter_33_10]|nr:MAG: hypothetical protein COV14_00450 [Candidatus Woesearchaeota archaeon CG10_big_fil_rev_8_21_14_0_10_33_12]PIU72541.1 MAG: hypothetical protein COS79_02435 [Candidatus Woesearchaeota archaeon CG06_land_8_20_14_3_00_33_13]PIZ53995.1 MAG: hypothetical protein COY26_00385 [Candidatus Woesearchaeota archaeon CG_4_10_14_0_2_um_filter_33_10]